MSFLKRLWPFARNSVTITVRADVHPDLVRAMHALNASDILAAYDAIEDYYQAVKEESR